MLWTLACFMKVNDQRCEKAGNAVNPNFWSLTATPATITRCRFIQTSPPFLTQLDEWPLYSSAARHQPILGTHANHGFACLSRSVSATTTRLEISSTPYLLWFPASIAQFIIVFLFPEDDRAGKGLRDYLVSIDAIEEKTGFDFLAGLRDNREERVVVQ